MKMALSEFVLRKKGIYGILHVIILLLSLFLVISISIDTFKGIPFYEQSVYMEVQLWICALFLADFVLEWFLATNKMRYVATHFIFLLVAIPYQNIIAYMGGMKLSTNASSEPQKPRPPTSHIRPLPPLPIRNGRFSFFIL